MADLGNTTVFSQTDASNGSGTMPSWLGSAPPSTLDDAGRALQGAVFREWNWRNLTLTAGGSGTAMTLTYSVAPAAYYDGQRFAFLSLAVTGSCTLNVNALGAKTIKKVFGGTLTNLASGDIAAGAVVEVAYNTASDCFIWVNQQARTDTNGNVTFPGTAVMASSFLRNRIINGAMDVWQRGTSFSPGNQYSADRWYVNRAGGVSGVSFDLSAGAFGTKKNWMAIQRTNGDTNTATANIYQPIEGINCRDLAGQTVVLSILLGSGSTSASTNNLTLNLSYQTTGTDIGPTGSWTALSGTTFSVAAGTGPTRYTASFSVPSTATQLIPYITLGFAGTAGADDRYYITEVQLEAGSVATPFERRLYGQELLLCQRFYQKIYGSSSLTLIGRNNAAAANQGPGVNVFYKATMRAAPTGTVVGTWTKLNTAGGANPGFVVTGTESATLYVDSAAAGDCYYYAPTSSQGITLDAELA